MAQISLFCIFSKIILNRSAGGKEQIVNKHRRLTLRPFIYYRHCRHHSGSPDHHSQIQPPTSRDVAKLGTRSPRPRERGPAGNLSLRLPRPTRALTLKLGPDGCPGGGASSGDRPVSALSTSRRGLGREPNGGSAKSGRLGGVGRIPPAPSSPPLLSGSLSPRPHSPTPTPGTRRSHSRAPVQLPPSRQAPCGF